MAQVLGSAPVKRRRIQGSCDICRHKKIRCDSAEMPDNICSNCIAAQMECTHNEPVKKRGPKSGHVEQLENRIKKLESLLNKFLPDLNVSEELGKVDESWTDRPSPPVISSSADSPASNDDTHDSEDDLAHFGLAEHLAKLQIDDAPKRFFGPSSGFMLMKNAMKLKDDATGLNSRQVINNRPPYWIMRPWELTSAARWTPRYQFPDFDLLQSLVDLYFERINPYFPLLHEGTTRTALQEGLHLRNHQFAAVVLLLCALGSKFSDDPRVLIDGEQLSAGWQFYEQVPTIRKELFNIPTLYELQFYCLASLFVYYTSTPQAGWTMVGQGLRFCIDIGVHRRKPPGYKMTVDDELKKRAFWMLVTTERLMCSFMGRSCSIHSEDFDAELPVECDDEYWEILPDGQVTFNQPLDKPSVITGFLQLIELTEIMASALRHLYTIKKSKLHVGNVGERWERQFVAQLDSRLNQFFAAIPDHLRWDPNREDVLFFTHSAMLHALYYNIQIQIHRPFIHKPSPLTFSSLAICANAARCCIHVIEPQVARTGLVIPFQTLMAIMMSGVILLINIWGAKVSGISVPSTREWADVETCMRILKGFEDKWDVAGRYWDMLKELSPGEDVQVAELKKSSRKREHDGHSLHAALEPFASEESWLSSYESSRPREKLSNSPLDERHVDLLTSSGSLAYDFAEFLSTTSFPTYPQAEQGVLDTWSGTPVGFNLQDWGTYITTMGPVRATQY